jgi:hypothetical protein
MWVQNDVPTPPSFMKFCPVVPEICRGHVYVPKKERRRIIIYNYNTITFSQFNNYGY